jgi:hypothetical protein
MPIQTKSADTLILEARLRDTSPDDVVTYEEMSVILGRDVREYCKSSLITARKTMQSESIFFDVERGVGIVRLSSDGATKASTSYVRRAKSATRKGLKHLRHVPFAELSEEGKRMHMTTSTQLGLMDLFGSSKSAKKIETTVVKTGGPLPIGRTLELFRGESK